MWRYEISHGELARLQQVKGRNIPGRGKISDRREKDRRRNMSAGE